MTMKLSVENVTELFATCLRDDPAQGVEIEAVVHAARVDVTGHEQDIGDLVKQLPVEFQPASEGGGGGMSFLNMCTDRDGNLWTGMHLVMEQLCILALAADKIEWCLPRDFWGALPGGMPYLVVK